MRVKVLHDLLNFLVPLFGLAFEFGRGRHARLWFRSVSLDVSTCVDNGERVDMLGLLANGGGRWLRPESMSKCHHSKLNMMTSQWTLIGASTIVQYAQYLFHPASVPVGRTTKSK